MTKQIPLTQGKYAFVDDEDYEYLMQWNWHIHSAGYATRKQYLGGGRQEAKYRTIYMHRNISNTPDNMQTDHMNGNRLDNRKENLRVCNKKENLRNRVKSSDKSSCYKGVQFDKRSKKWRSRIKLDKDTHLGYFNCPILAAKAYNDAALKHFGTFARLNIFTD